MSYCIADGYIERRGAVQDPEREAKIRDDWQDEVYREAFLLYRDRGLCNVIDYGTGSGFKFALHFDDVCRLDMLGLDLQPTVDILREVYPFMLWMTVERYMKAGSVRPVDLVICADVIEHVDDPDRLLSDIRTINPKWLVISTPDRDLVPGAPKLGPPLNPTHVREWTFAEFGKYLEQHFAGKIDLHFYSNRGQATQCAVIKL